MLGGLLWHQANHLFPAGSEWYGVTGVLVWWWPVAVVMFFADAETTANLVDLATFIYLPPAGNVILAHDADASRVCLDNEVFNHIVDQTPV